MKRFIRKIISFAIAFVVFNAVLFFTLPKDNNSYMYEYQHKIQLLDTVSQPRIIFIGGSSVAFNNDSKMIGDSLKCNIINFGLHGGIGIRYPIEDALQYVRKGDVVVFQIEYENFTDGNGNKESFPEFMIINNWRNYEHLNCQQWKNIIEGTPTENVKNLKRIVKYPIKGSLNTPTNSKVFVYAKSGFNEYGDEISHLNFPRIRYNTFKQKEHYDVNKEFLSWLSLTLSLYEKAGAKIIMLPPCCVSSQFEKVYDENVAEALLKIKHPYIIEPSLMTADDSCAFNTGYHVTKEGVIQNSIHIINILKAADIIPTSILEEKDIVLKLPCPKSSGAGGD